MFFTLPTKSCQMATRAGYLIKKKTIHTYTKISFAIRRDSWPPHLYAVCKTEIFSFLSFSSKWNQMIISFCHLMRTENLDEHFFSLERGWFSGSIIDITRFWILETEKCQNFSSFFFEFFCSKDLHHLFLKDSWLNLGKRIKMI